MSMAIAAGNRIARRQLDVWEFLFLERLPNVERLFIQTEKCFKISVHLVFDNALLQVTCYRQKCTFACHVSSER